ncbi:glycosyltransferase [Blastomonas fulva]|jgi:glycosyltransferase involved in cell wall biosynthesis|uniref:glycosyltransferase n=1 Tax=Blastomonas fulva TaxID=1550728 RepID=UPI003D285FD3
MILIDFTHMDKRSVSGIERVCQTLFTGSDWDCHQVEYVRGGSTLKLIIQQWFGIPLRMLLDGNAILICPGFPPSPIVTFLFRRRLFVYVYDLFLIERKADLNWRARWYMAPSFRYAIGNAKNFFALTDHVRSKLLAYARSDAQIRTVRPEADNIFSLAPRAGGRDGKRDAINVLSIGTVEPRKNYLYAADICDQLALIENRPVHLHIIGRRGWGSDFDALSARPNVRLHGFVGDDDMAQLIETCDFFVYVPHDEGLGLPALEVQYSGIPVVASDLAVFRETLDTSAVFVDPSDPRRAAGVISQALAARSEFDALSSKAKENVQRWNLQSGEDRRAMFEWIEGACP